MSRLRFFTFVRARPPAAVLLTALWIGGCGAVYPEVSSPVRSAPEGAALAPPPPEDLLYVTVEQASIPTRARDGRQWDRIGGNAPDPFAKIFVDGRELLRTPVQANTLQPTWPDQIRANHRIPLGSVLKVEVWDSNPIHNRPICTKTLHHVHRHADSGTVQIDCESGAGVVLRVEPARPKLGAGLYYELRSDGVYVTRVFRHSPAARAGLRSGDQILTIQGKDVVAMEDGEAQSLINTYTSTGLKLRVKHPDGKVETLTLKDGPIYPVHGEEVRPD